MTTCRNINIYEKLKVFDSI